jgi:hypothetical protein
MKNITLSAKEDSIDKARRVAANRHSTLNEMFREWLEDVNKENSDDRNVAKKLGSLWERTSYLKVGKKISREEMHER